MIEAVGSSDGEEEVGLMLRQTTHWRSAPWKSQPAQLVAQIYCAYNSQSAGEPQVEESEEGASRALEIARNGSYLVSIQHPFVALQLRRGG